MSDNFLEFEMRRSVKSRSCVRTWQVERLFGESHAKMREDSSCYETPTPMPCNELWYFIFTCRTFMRCVSYRARKMRWRKSIDSFIVWPRKTILSGIIDRRSSSRINKKIKTNFLFFFFTRYNIIIYLVIKISLEIFDCFAINNSVDQPRKE